MSLQGERQVTVSDPSELQKGSPGGNGPMGSAMFSSFAQPTEMLVLDEADGSEVRPGCCASFFVKVPGP